MGLLLEGTLGLCGDTVWGLNLKPLRGEQS